jgi:glycosyltransferase involved in cell wall biosynthesis
VKQPMLFSVVMPTHNRLHLLRDAIETVRRQEFKEWEVVVFDNASKDGIADHVGSLNDERVRYARSDLFLPVTTSWNRAIDLARGDYVVLLGDDDGLTPQYFKRLIEIIDEFKRPDVIYNNIYQFWHPGVAPWEPSGYLIDVKHGFFFANRDKPFLLSKEDARRAALGSIRLKINFSFNSQALMYNRQFLKQLCSDGPVYRSSFPDYYIANVALMRSKSTVIVPEALAVAGVSKASYGYTMYNNGHEDRGAALLNTNLSNDPVYREIEHRLLPGPAYNTNFVLAMEYVARALPELNAKVDYQRYRRIQIFAALKAAAQSDGGEASNTWPMVRKRLSPVERAWAACVWQIIAGASRYPVVQRHLVSAVNNSIKMSGSDPMVRYCGKHDFSRVTDLYDAFVTGTLS